MVILSVLETQEETVFSVGVVFFWKASSVFFFSEDKLGVQMLYECFLQVWVFIIAAHWGKVFKIAHSEVLKRQSNELETDIFFFFQVHVWMCTQDYIFTGVWRGEINLAEFQ